MLTETQEQVLNEQSEFGKGYAYCLGLFIAHEFRMMEWEKLFKEQKLMDASMWFNGAADHLFELQIPEALPAETKARIEAFQNKCLGFRLCMRGEECTYNDARKAVQEAKDFLLEWDAFNGIPTAKGQWE